MHTQMHCDSYWPRPCLLGSHATPERCASVAMGQAGVDPCSQLTCVSRLVPLVQRRVFRERFGRRPRARLLREGCRHEVAKVGAVSRTVQRRRVTLTAFTRRQGGTGKRG